jgi:hypothetical protein
MDHELNQNGDDALQIAKSYATAGFKILPLHTLVDGQCTCGASVCHSPGKHPVIKNGVHGATTDAVVLEDWWHQAPDANIGIAAGDGIVVVDIDPKHNGMATLSGWEAAHGPMPRTPTVKTGSGGRHYYFRCPNDKTIGNRTAIGPGIDIRGTNGYVVAPPSLHASGQRYEWLTSLSEPLATIPTWLCDYLEQSPHTPRGGASGGLIMKVADSLEDLPDHPGAGEGTRHDTLCRLVGRHLAMGDSQERILEQAYSWGERCKPPMGEMEIERVVTGIARKHRDSTDRAAVAVDEDVDQVPLPSPPAWPHLHDDALQGVLGEIVTSIKPHTEADPVAVLFTAIAIFGNIVGRSPHFMIEGDQHHTNMFCAIVGDSSRGRKGTSLSRTLSLFSTADPKWYRDCRQSGLSSGEGLIHAVRDPITETQVVSKKDEAPSTQVFVKDPGVADKRLFVVESEFAQTLKVMKREGNTLSPVIRQAWDNGRLQVLTKMNSSKATDAHISILAHITRAELIAQMGSTDYLNGFANRFLWVRVRRSKLLPDGGAFFNASPFQQRLSQSVDKAYRIKTMTRSREARALWFSVYPELTAESPGTLGAVIGRGEAQTLRLSMIYALIEGSAIIEESHLRAALAAWRYCVASASGIFPNTAPLDPLDAKLLAAIQAHPGINRRGLHKATGGNVKAVELAQSLARLRDAGLAHDRTAGNTGGRNGEQWSPYSEPLVAPLMPEAEAEPVPVVSPATAAPGVVRSAASTGAPCHSCDEEWMSEEDFDAEIMNL